MRRAPVRVLGIGLVSLGAHAAPAQVVDTVIAQGMDVADGLVCAATPGVSDGVRAGSAPAPRAGDTVHVVRPPERHGAIDTTLVLAIDRRDWQRDSYDGGLAISTDDLLHTASRFTACAGASVHLGHASVALRGVRGLVRLRGDFGALERAGGRRTQDDRAPRRSRSIPPAGPPRR